MGEGGGRGRGGERREGLPPLQPAPPSGPLAGRCRRLAGSEGNAGPGAPQREGPLARGPCIGLHRATCGASFAPWQTSCRSRAKHGPTAGLTTAHGHASPSGDPGRLTCGQIRGWLPHSPQPCGSISSCPAWLSHFLALDPCGGYLLFLVLSLFVCQMGPIVSPSRDDAC